MLSPSLSSLTSWQVKRTVTCLLCASKRSACKLCITCRSTLPSIINQITHISFIQHSKFCVMDPQTLQNLKPVDDHHKCLKLWLLKRTLLKSSCNNSSGEIIHMQNKTVFGSVCLHIVIFFISLNPQHSHFHCNLPKTYNSLSVAPENVAEIWCNSQVFSLETVRARL